MRRIGFSVIAGVLLAFSLPPALAGACNDPTLGVGKSTVGPGEVVPFTIVNAQPGASYTLTIANRVVASGTSSSADGESGSFAMPDLGGSQEVAVELEVRHTGSLEAGHNAGPWPPDSEAIHFVVPVAAAAPAGQTAPAPQSPPAARATDDGQPSSSSGSPAPHASAIGPRASSQRGAARSQPMHAAKGVASSPRTTRATSRAITRPAPVAARDATVVAARRLARASRARRAPVTLAQPSGGARRAPAPAPAARLQAVPRDGGRAPDPLLLGALALGFGLLAHGAGGWARLRRRVPAAHAAAPAVGAHAGAAGSGSDAVEAELQRLLADATTAGVVDAPQREKTIA